MDKGKSKYRDFICFYDDDDKQKELFVKVLEISAVLKFETQDGNVISIPMHRVKKVKQKKGVDFSEN